MPQNSDVIYGQKKLTSWPTPNVVTKVFSSLHFKSQSLKSIPLKRVSVSFLDLPMMAITTSPLSLIQSAAVVSFPTLVTSSPTPRGGPITQNQESWNYFDFPTVFLKYESWFLRNKYQSTSVPDVSSVVGNEKVSVEGERDGDDDEHARAEDPRERGALSDDRDPVADNVLS